MTQIRDMIESVPPIKDTALVFFSTNTPSSIIEDLAYLISIHPDAVISGSLVIDMRKPEPEPNMHYQHTDGSTRSISNRMERAMRVNCPTCKEPVGQPCFNMSNNTYDHGKPVRYPHNSRTREAIRVEHEQQMELDLKE